MSFDPYHQWLGIPPEQQPPDCYQLLGVRRFEQNPTVISNAAERQLLMLKSLQSGPHAALAQKLMNAVTAARIRLLDPDKKTRYDAELKKRVPADRSTPPPLTTDPIGSQRSEPPSIQESSSIAQPPKRPVAKAVVRNEDAKRRQAGAARAKTRWRVGIIAGVVAAASLIMIAVWVSLGDDSSQIAQGQADRQQRVRSDQRARTQSDQNGSRPRVPPWVKLQREKFRNAKTQSDVDQTRTTQTAENKDNEIDVSSLVDGGDDHKVAGEPGDLAGPDGMSSDGEEHPSVAGVGGEETGAGDASEETETSEAQAFTLLPSQINLPGTVSTTGTDYVFVGKLASPANDSWKIAIDDYGAPSGQSKFLVGKGALDDEGMHWPLFRLVRGEAPLDTDTDAGDSSPSDILAQVDADSTELSLWLSDPKNGKLIDQLSRCGLIVTNEQQSHHVQLAVPRHIPPVVLSLDKTRERIAFDVLGDNELAPTRLNLEILHVGYGTQQVAEGLGLQAGFGEELTAPLDAGLQCELGITLTESEDLLSMSVSPRYVHDDRKEALAPSKLTREITRSKAQLVRNRRDLAEAQNALRLLPGEIARARSMSARTSPEAAARQSRLGQLSGMLGSAQSRVRRLSSVVPELAASVQRMEEVLNFSKDLPDKIEVHFRVYARGEMGNYLLLVATDSDSDPAATGDVSR